MTILHVSSWDRMSTWDKAKPTAGVNRKRIPFDQIKRCGSLDKETAEKVRYAKLQLEYQVLPRLKVASRLAKIWRRYLEKGYKLPLYNLIQRDEAELIQMERDLTKRAKVRYYSLGEKHGLPAYSQRRI